MLGVNSPIIQAVQVSRDYVLAGETIHAVRSVDFEVHRGEFITLVGRSGSGKTTLIIRLADALARKQRRVAVVVNEVGEIGIDNQLMRSVGLDVWELSSGCICCSLAGDLLQTLEQLAADHAPEIVIVEASRRGVLQFTF